jgi:hypothetical protein
MMNPYFTRKSTYLLTLRPLHRHPRHHIRSLFLGALGQEGGQLFDVVRGVDGVTLRCGSEGIAETNCYVVCVYLASCRLSSPLSALNGITVTLCNALG